MTLEGADGPRTSTLNSSAPDLSNRSRRDTRRWGSGDFTFSAAGRETEGRSATPTTTLNAAARNGVSMWRFRIQAIASSSMATTTVTRPAAFS